MSDMVASANGSLSMMTSVLVSPDGIYEYEAAHGTVTRHYYRYLKGEKTPSNPIATLFAWTGALARRGEMDNLEALTDFAHRVEAATQKTIAGGILTGDLAPISSRPNVQGIDFEQFLTAVAQCISK